MAYIKKRDLVDISREYIYVNILFKGKTSHYIYYKFYFCERKDCMSDIWNKNTNKSSRIRYSVIGIILMIISSFIFSITYNHGYNFNKYLILANCSVFFALGLEFIILIFNMKNKRVKSILLILLGGYIVFNFYNEYIRIGSVLLLFSLLIFIIIAFTKNIFSTLITFTMISTPFFLILLFLFKLFPSHENAVFYLTIVLLFLTYRIFGVKANRYFIGKFMGTNKEAQMYDAVQLKEQINFIYLIAFAFINIGNWFYNNNEIMATILNNAFVSGIAITNINWRIIFSLQKNDKAHK